MKRYLIFGVFLGLLGSVFGGEMKVVSLHPLIGDMLKQVGGERVEVVDLIGKNGDPHSFEPKAGDIAKAVGVKVYFVSGMGLEGYLGEMKAILPNDARIVEVGATLPALEGACDHEGHDHGDEHEHEHELDPHWWHSVDLYRRAVGVVKDELSKEFPEAKDEFEANAFAYQGKLDELDKWIRKEVVGIPKDRRKLATAHAAFEYFCERYGFESFPVQGLNREQMPDAVSLAKMISDLKEEKVRAIFPEKESNPKILTTLANDAGIKLGGELVADGRGVESYEEMMKANVAAIVAGLSGE